MTTRQRQEVVAVAVRVVEGAHGKVPGIYG